MHILNIIKDIFDPRDKIVPPAKAEDVVKVSFRDKVPYIKDQGDEGSCIGHGCGEHFELMSRLHPSEIPLTIPRDTIRLSPNFLYGQCRKMDGDFDIDQGSNLRSAFRVLNQIGCCLESDDLYSDATLYSLPTASMLASAALLRFDAYHRIPDVATAKSVLVSGYSFAIGTLLFRQFESNQASKDGLIAMPEGNSIGGHCMHVIGADDTKGVLGEVGAFEVQNSWGDEWGDSGYAWIPYAYLDQVWPDSDAWVGHWGHWGTKSS